MLKGKKILLGITGSIAAYKSLLLIRLLIKEGAEVKVVMTNSAKDFVSPLVVSVLSKNKVITDLIEDNTWSNHVLLSRWADLFLIAPLSCNTIAKMANGICDNVLLAIYLSATCKIVIAPAMDEDMWLHPATQNNLRIIKDFGNEIIPVDSGELASGLTGEGRMAEPEAIIAYIKANYFRKDLLKGKKILVTAGPTREPIDPVRFLSNHSSGKMGFAIADTCYENGADVILITGPTKEKCNYAGIKRIDIVSSDDMYEACKKFAPDMQVIIMSAAVADYKIENIAREKIKKQGHTIQLELTKTKDILHFLGTQKKENQFLVGFALETNNERENAKIKLKNKNLDCIVLNSLRDDQAGFNFDTNKVTIIDKNENEISFELKSKKEIAADIITYILNKINA